MTVPESGTSANRQGGPRRLVRYLPISLVVAAYAVFLWWNFMPGLAAFDEHGYYAQGSLLASTGKTGFIPESRAEYVGQHWFPTAEGRYYSRHSPGLALLVAAAMRIFGSGVGPSVSFAINPFLSLLGLLGMFLLARDLLGRWWGLAGASLLAGNPSYAAHSLAGDSHMLVTVLVLWGLYLALLWRRSARIGYAFAAGLVLGCVPVARAPEAVCAVGVGLVMILSWPAYPRIRRHYLAAVAGAAIPIIPLLIYDQVAFGAFWKTAYALTGEQSAFSLANVGKHFGQYLRGLVGIYGVGLLFPLGLAGLVVMLLRRGWRALGLGLTVAAVPTILLYMAYYWAPRGQASMIMRFLLPIFPLLILGALWLLLLITGRLKPATRIALVAVLVGLHLIQGVPTGLARCHAVFNQKAVPVAVARGVEANISHGSVVMANPGALMHLDFLRRWRLADPMLAIGVPEQEAAKAAGERGGLGEGGRQRYWVLGPEQSCEAFRNDLAVWSGGAPIYCVGSESQVKSTLEMLGYPPTFVVVGRAAMPTPAAVPDFDPFGALLRRVPWGKPAEGGPGDRAGRDRSGAARASARPQGTSRPMRAAEDLVIVEVRDHGL